MAKVPTVYLAVRADTGQVKKNMTEAQKAFVGFQNSLKKSRGGSRTFTTGLKNIAASALGVTAGIASVGIAIRKFVQDISKMQTMTIQLETATGSADKAKVKFKELVETASMLPVSIQDVTRAFIKLQNMGLEPTRNTIVSFTNTASALGKTLQQFVEAVADAGTREFERLKEFGIMTRNEGENIRFIFQKNETVVKNTTSNIVKYLTALGNHEFAGAAEKQMQTIQGAANNLGDAIFQLNTALGEDFGGFLQERLAVMAKNFKGMATMVSNFNFNSDLEDRIESLTEQLADGATEVDAMRQAFSELGVVHLENVEAKMMAIQKKLAPGYRSLFKPDTDALTIELELLREAYHRLQREQMKGLAAEKAVNDARNAEREARLSEASAIQGQAAMERIALEWTIKHSKSKLLINAAITKQKLIQAEAEKKIIAASQGSIFDEHELKRVIAEYDKATQSLENLDDALEKMDKNALEYRKQMQSFAEDIRRGFADAIIEGENLRGVLRSVLKEIAKSSLLQAIGGFGGKDNQPFGLLGAIGKSFKPRATGGPVSANEPYMVGEKGPELFTPSGAGSILPAHRSGKGGGNNVSVVNNFSIDGGDKQEIQSMIAQSVSASVNLAVAKMADNNRRRV